MNIAVFGFYHKLNVGDDRLQYCISRLLGRNNNLVFFDHALPLPPRIYLNQFDWMIIGGGGIAINRIGLWVDIKGWTKRIRCKIGVLGIGINTNDSGLIQELHELLKASEFFIVRDNESKALLRNDDKIQVFPDLTWIYPLCHSNFTIKTKKSIALNVFEIDGFNSNFLLSQLNDFIIHPMPFYFNGGRDTKVFSKKTNVPDEFFPHVIESSELVLAARFHAIIFAMQLGVPFLAINYDKKVERLIHSLGIPELLINSAELHDIRKKIDFVFENKDRILLEIEAFKSKAIEQANFLGAEIVKIVKPRPKNILDRISYRMSRLL